MDYYFAAADAAEAIGALELPAPSARFDAVEAKDVMPCPHLDQLIEAATGAPVASAVSELRTVWPPADTPPPADDNSPWLSGPTLSELPRRIRDALAEIAVTPAVGQAGAEALWGFDAETAQRLATDIVGLARRARAEGKPVFWWSEL